MADFFAGPPPGTGFSPELQQGLEFIGQQQIAQQHATNERTAPAREMAAQIKGKLMMMLADPLQLEKIKAEGLTDDLNGLFYGLNKAVANGDWSDVKLLSSDRLQKLFGVMGVPSAVKDLQTPGKLAGVGTGLQIPTNPNAVPKYGLGPGMAAMPGFHPQIGPLSSLPPAPNMAVDRIEPPGGSAYLAENNPALGMGYNPTFPLVGPPPSPPLPLPSNTVGERLSAYGVPQRAEGGPVGTGSPAVGMGQGQAVVPYSGEYGSEYMLPPGFIGPPSTGEQTTAGVHNPVPQPDNQSPASTAYIGGEPGVTSNTTAAAARAGATTEPGTFPTSHGQLTPGGIQALVSENWNKDANVQAAQKEYDRVSQRYPGMHMYQAELSDRLNTAKQDSMNRTLGYLQVPAEVAAKLGQAALGFGRGSYYGAIGAPLAAKDLAVAGNTVAKTANIPRETNIKQQNATSRKTTADAAVTRANAYSNAQKGVGNLRTAQTTLAGARKEEVDAAKGLIAEKLKELQYKASTLPLTAAEKTEQSSLLTQMRLPPIRDAAGQTKPDPRSIAATEAYTNFLGRVQAAHPELPPGVSSLAGAISYFKKNAPGLSYKDYVNRAKTLYPTLK